MSVRLPTPPPVYDMRDQGEVRMALESVLRTLNESTNSLPSEVNPPTLDVDAAVSDTDVTYTPNSDGAVEYKVDGGAWTAAGGAIVVPRNLLSRAPKMVVIRATGTNDKTKELSFTVPEQGSMTTATFDSLTGFLDQTANTIEVTFTATGMPPGTTYNLVWENSTTGAMGTADGITSGYVVLTPCTNGDFGKLTLNAVAGGVLLAQQNQWGQFPF